MSICRKNTITPGRRPAVINLKLKDGNRKRYTSITVEDRDFYAVYAMVVKEVEAFHGCTDPRTHQRLIHSDGLFMHRYGLATVPKTYFQLERTTP